MSPFKSAAIPGKRCLAATANMCPIKAFVGLITHICEGSRTRSYTAIASAEDDIVPTGCSSASDTTARATATAAD